MAGLLLCRRSGAALAIALTLLAAPTSAAATAADKTATHAYLQADYELHLVLLRNAPAARMGTTALLVRLGHECPGVLAHAPSLELGLEAEPIEAPPSPRVKGERERISQQRIAIDGELGAAVAAAGAQPSRSAIEAFVAATTPLSWSDARVAPLVREELDTLQELAPASPPDVCGDMTAWSASGYRHLSPATKTFSERLTTKLERAIDAPSLTALLKPYEGPAERALIRKTEALELRVAKSSGALNAISRLERTLGVPASASEKQRHAPVLGRGTTRSGPSFTIRPEASSSRLGHQCHPAVAVEFSEDPPGGGLIGFSRDETICLGRNEPRRPSGSCSDNEASISAAVAERVSRVRLRLSDGSAVTSRVVRVPRKYGGPVGVYVQVIREHGRRPVSMTELDARGRTVRVVRLHVPICKKEPQPIGPKLSKLVQSTTPEGTPFRIEGSLVEFPGHVPSFSVSAEVSGPTMGDGGAMIAVGKPGSPPKPPPLRRLIGCPPHSFAIVYGLLTPPGDSVLARTPDGLVPLAKQQLDPSLHAEGPLVYGAFAELPSELIIRGADGSTLYTESLVAKAKEAAEFCEGFSEG